MTHYISIFRTFLFSSLIVAGLASSAAAQDIFKSRAEMFNAEAAAKQANATIITATAEFGKAQAEVGKIGQEIREKAANNDLLEAEVFYKKRAQYHEYKAARANARKEQATHSEQPAPAQLTSYELGAIPENPRWPTLLNAPSYKSTVRHIDGLLARRTPDDSGAGSQNCVNIMAALQTLQHELRRNIKLYNATDYLAARKFLDALALEVQEPVLPSASAMDKVARH